MGAAREPDQADFDLERFIEMFDEALTSRDERVVNALQSLMMMVILTKSENSNPMGERIGPLRRMYEDLHVVNRRMRDLEETVKRLDNMRREEKFQWDDLKKYSMQPAGTGTFKEHYEDELVKIRSEFIKQLNGGKF